MSYRVLGTDRILEVAVAPGTTDVTLGNPVPGYRSFFSALSPNDTCTYFIEAIDANGVPTGDWERGYATFIDATGPQLVRSLVMDSSNSGNLVNFITDVRVGSGLMSETKDTSFLPGGRLSISATDPVANGESNTLYYVSYFNDNLPLFNGYGLQTIKSSSTGISVSAFPANSAYDVFGYVSTDATSVMGLELNPWTDPNTRKDSLIYANGFLCKSTDLTRRYLGSVYIGSTAGLLQDWDNYQNASQNPSKRFVWNMYNRVRRGCQMFDTTVGWPVTGDGTWRIINGLTAPQGCLEIFRGLDEDLVEAHGLVNANVQSLGNYFSSIGVDSNTPVATGSLNYSNFNNTTNKAMNLALPSVYFGRPGIGYHTIRMLEMLQTGGAATGGSSSQSGLLGVTHS
jgi:hypothetical protein